MNDELLRDWIQVGRVNNEQTAVTIEGIRNLGKSLDKLDYTLNNGPITKLDKKMTSIWRLMIGIITPLIGVISTLIWLLIRMKP